MSLTEKIALIQTVIVGISAITALSLLYRSRTDARRNALISQLTLQSSDPRWAPSLIAFDHYINKSTPSEILSILNDSAKLQETMFQLDNRERMSIGMYFGSVDETIYKAYAYGFFIQGWKSMEPLIQVIRIKYKRPQIYQYYEHIAKEWMQSPPAKPSTYRIDA